MPEKRWPSKYPPTIFKQQRLLQPFTTKPIFGPFRSALPCRERPCEADVRPRDRRQLEAIVGNRNAQQKHVWRAKIILATADGYGTTEIMRRSGKAKPVVWRRQAPFMAEGLAPA